MERFDDEIDQPSCSIKDLPEHNSEVKISMYNVLQFTINLMIFLIVKLKLVSDYMLRVLDTSQN